MPATRQLMRRVTADASVADFVIAGFGSVPGVTRNGMSDTFQPGNITEKTDLHEKFDTQMCVSWKSYQYPPHTHTTKNSLLPQNLWKNYGKIAPLHAMKGYGGVEVHSTLS